MKTFRRLKPSLASFRPREFPSGYFLHKVINILSYEFNFYLTFHLKMINLKKIHKKQKKKQEREIK